MTSSQVSSALDDMFERPQGLYGSFEEIPVIAQAGHMRRVELLERLKIGDVSQMTVVDFGMGSWGFASVFTKLHTCARAIGMDTSKVALKMSRELVATSNPVYAHRFETYQSDGMDLPLSSGSIDLFFSGESIEHVRFPPRFLSEVHRLLRSGGQLVITTPNRDAILYKEKGEEYCTSPEHFWLFNTNEVVTSVSEFFQIEEVYGFNGSYGSHEEDRAIKSREQAYTWSRMFENEPEKATGIVLRATPKPNITKSYRIREVQSAELNITGADSYLPLEFGLSGLLLDNQNASVNMTRFPSDGVVCRFWCHRWSGIANISTDAGVEEVDLYTRVPGWRNWVSRRQVGKITSIQITPSMRRNPKSEACQVIFFEAFTFKIDDDRRTARDAVQEGEQLPSAPVPLRTQGYGFARYQRIVSTTVFHWFSTNEGNTEGPWPPIGGRTIWDGSVQFWRSQIKDIMLANIDAIYLHLIPDFENYRITFFRAYSELRSEGWDVPKLAPFLDPFGIWRNAQIDLATDEGKRAFLSHYVRFYKQYFNENQDSLAAEYLLTIDGRLALSTWWVSLLKNVESLQRSDVEDALRTEFADRVPQLSNGVWMITTALVDPDLSFSDERVVMFSGYTYAIHSVHAGIDVWHVQPGYWDQNIRKPGYLLPRDGGKNYRRAWEIVVANMPYVNRVYIESWNEYNEGSGIYPADPGGLFVNTDMHLNSDVFSDDNDPYEYVLTTAAGTSRINGKPELDARFLWFVSDRNEATGQIIISLVARNEGNTRWTTLEGFGLYVLCGSRVAGFFPIKDGCGDTRAQQRGIVRGQPVAFRLAVEVEPEIGELIFTVGCRNRFFGEQLTVTLAGAPSHSSGVTSPAETSSQPLGRLASLLTFKRWRGRE
jgi:SAM-dependent methyltransferase